MKVFCYLPSLRGWWEPIIFPKFSEKKIECFWSKRLKPIFECWRKYLPTISRMLIFQMESERKYQICISWPLMNLNGVVKQDPLQSIGKLVEHHCFFCTPLGIYSLTHTSFVNFQKRQVFWLGDKGCSWYPNGTGMWTRMHPYIINERFGFRTSENQTTYIWCVAEISVVSRDHKYCVCHHINWIVHWNGSNESFWSQWCLYLSFEFWIFW